ncbi:RES family NAD+ phosphorylase [Sphingomonas cavernae]|uniref:RES domain-containing protein n=1 Tax=Sphingomonas cavernae TaxID=2320861 RepID=A0A418WL85_9SPHN|nr:RES family NAD+ phosphorylase [Sphingomonas cavernae]RJF90814.1 RES domain-containing protein [Sphingomonas cavernae]
MIVWRISEHADLDGVGGTIVGGRWHSKGRPIVYAADSSALAMLEVLVHLEVETMPAPFQLMRIAFDDGLAATEWPENRLPRDIAESRAWGDTWLKTAETPVARVPSVIAPDGTNWLLNPLHPAARSARILAKSRWPWDKRLFRR